MTSFSDLGVAADVDSQLRSLGITTPTPIQAQAIPIALTGRDLIGIAQTGTGKTFAFGLPMLARLSRSRAQALVLVPTRELADQVEASLVAVGRRFGLRTALLIGGASMSKQLGQLRRRPHVIVATPGRLIDHLVEHSLALDDVTILVLDEADRMLDMGFAPQVNQILRALPAKRQTLLFSATMPAAISELATRTLREPVTVSVAPAGTTVDRVDQSLIVVEKGRKADTLRHLLGEASGSALVFTRTKYGAKKLCRVLNQAGFATAEIHGNRSLPQRREALAGFKAGQYRVLVATDIAARGIDVVGIDLVVNYDLPMQPEDYVHRIGRTARAGLSGRAVSFAQPDQASDVRAIERLIGSEIPRVGDMVQFDDDSTSRCSGHRHRRPQSVQSPQVPHPSHHRRFKRHHRDHRPVQAPPHPTWTEPSIKTDLVVPPKSPPDVVIDPTSPFIV